MKPIPRHVALKRRLVEDQIRLYAYLRWEEGHVKEEAESVIEADIATFAATKREEQQAWEDLHGIS